MKTLTEKIVIEKVSKFEPSMKIIFKLLKTILERGSETRTNLAMITNLNYARMSLHIQWLEQKGLVESIIDSSKIKFNLTSNGRLFSSLLSL